MSSEGDRFVGMSVYALLSKPMKVKSAVYENRRLPESEWRPCGVCGGTGLYYEQGDLHRSAGMVPCSCGDGTIRLERVLVEKPVYRVRSGRRRI